MEITNYIGKPISTLLTTEQFNGKYYLRAIENETYEPSISYVFSSLEIEILCDLDETIRTIFLIRNIIGDTKITDIDFSLSRNEVRKKFGIPSKSGGKSTSEFLGPYGAWDRFKKERFTIHIEYNLDFDGIRRVTIMRNDVVPS